MHWEIWCEFFFILYQNFDRVTDGLSTLLMWIVEGIGIGDSDWFPLYARFLTYVPSIACLFHLGTVVLQIASLASKIGVYFCDMALERTNSKTMDMIYLLRKPKQIIIKKCYTPLIFSTFQALSGAGNGDPQHCHNHFPIDRKEKSSSWTRHARVTQFSSSFSSIYSWKKCIYLHTCTFTSSLESYMKSFITSYIASKHHRSAFRFFRGR